jgi:hypothetical protein
MDASADAGHAASQSTVGIFTSAADAAQASIEQIPVIAATPVGRKLIGNVLKPATGNFYRQRE